jgi:hypothetical protein
MQQPQRLLSEAASRLVTATWKLSDSVPLHRIQAGSTQLVMFHPCRARKTAADTKPEGERPSAFQLSEVRLSADDLSDVNPKAAGRPCGVKSGNLLRHCHGESAPRSVLSHAEPWHETFRGCRTVKATADQCKLTAIAVYVANQRSWAILERLWRMRWSRMQISTFLSEDKN